MVDPRTELIGVIDADYQLDAGLPARVRAAVRRSAGRVHPGAAGLPRLGAGAVLPAALLLLQVLLRGLAALAQRARRGDLRRHHGPDPPRRRWSSAGGWDEWCITEDAELSLRLLRDGWSGLHVDRSFGHGRDAADLRGAQGPAVPLVLRRDPDPAPALAADAARVAEPRNRMDQGQRWAYLSGAVQWYGDLLARDVLPVPAARGRQRRRSAAGCCSASSAASCSPPSRCWRCSAWCARSRCCAAAPAPPGATRSGAFMIWQSTSIVVARASVQGLFAKEAEFLRTPKTAEDAHWWDAVRGNLAGVPVRRRSGIAGIVGSLATGDDRRLHHRRPPGVADSGVRRGAAEQPRRPAGRPAGRLDARRRTEYRRFGARPATVTWPGCSASPAPSRWPPSCSHRPVSGSSPPTP